MSNSSLVSGLPEASGVRFEVSQVSQLATTGSCRQHPLSSRSLSPSLSSSPSPSPSLSSCGGEYNGLVRSTFFIE